MYFGTAFFFGRGELVVDELVFHLLRRRTLTVPGYGWIPQDVVHEDLGEMLFLVGHGVCRK